MNHSRVTDTGDFAVELNAEEYDSDQTNEPEFIDYSSFVTGGFVAFHDDAGAVTTFAMENIDDILDALNEIKTRYLLEGGKI